MFLILVTPCLVVAVQPCMEWITIKEKKHLICFGWFMNVFLFCVMFFCYKVSYPAITAVKSYMNLLFLKCQYVIMSCIHSMSTILCQEFWKQNFQILMLFIFFWEVVSWICFSICYFNYKIIFRETSYIMAFGTFSLY